MDTAMKKTVMETSCMEETAKFAYEMAQNAEPGQVYALIGDLGVGKTVFTKGFADCLHEGIRGGTGNRGAREFAHLYDSADL